MIGHMHAQVIARLPNAVFAGCCDAGSGRAEALCQKFGGRRYADCSEMMADPAIEVVTIATPSGLHLERPSPPQKPSNTSSAKNRSKSHSTALTG
jgi:predicted dehydrogenase